MDDVRQSSSVKKRIFDVIQIGNKTDLISTAFDVVISVLILLSIGVTFLPVLSVRGLWNTTLRLRWEPIHNEMMTLSS